MTTLVLHRGSLRANPYERWLADHGEKIVLLASAEQLALFGEELPTEAPYLHAEALTGYDTGPHVAERAAELVERFGVTDVVACQEFDIERAAALRERYGLPGQRPGSALVYRDKWRMKQAAVRARIPVADHALLRSADDLGAFADRHGLPLVVKPRRGALSVGVSVLRTREELAGWLRTAEIAGPDGEPQWLAEVFVEGSMCHIDGTVLDGRIATLWPSQYQYALADYRDRKGRVDIALDTADPLARRLVAFGERVLEAFGGPEHFAFHIEVFHTPDGELVLCEAASRAGGAGVRDVQRVLFGFDPMEYPVRRQLGLPVDAGERRDPERLAGQLLFTKRPGVLRALPDPAALPPGVVKYTTYAEVGQSVRDASHSGDFLAAFVVTGADRAETEARIRVAEAWFRAGLDIG
ncbi:NikS protein [Streptomyces sp. ICN441]|uniref:NikS protein n=1 Tax=Streptomyces tirandamycinicus TaxID=2174846 RepID=A0A2S1T2C2_9ACTN|nr:MULTISPECIES: NikS protein [Streptomyces]AWI32778.1 NikS protein [Streptomyces tirandamycinicus]TFE42851.1 NikS protein [Streptomyces sp. ICN441]